jgi:choline dehydrogenase-like flavoprotein
LIDIGGTTGLVVATRLARANPKLSIVVLEQGANTRNDPQIINPALYLTNIAPNSQTATFHKSEAAEEVAGREAIVPSGKCLGGGSAINFMVYSRPQSIDFDDWKTDGWRGSDMVPFLRKVGISDHAAALNLCFDDFIGLLLCSVNVSKTPILGLIEIYMGIRVNLACLLVPMHSLRSRMTFSKHAKK